MVETTVETKRCTVCGKDLPLTEFHKNCKSKDGRKGQCKECILTERRANRPPSDARRVRAPEHLRSLRELKMTIPTGMKPCANCLDVKTLDAFGSHANFPDGKQSWCKACVGKDHKDNGRKRRFKWMYDLTVEEYDEMLERQNFGCAICGTTEPGGKDNVFNVDHDHSMGFVREAVRGLLCTTCNTGIGLFVDDPDHLDKAANYLRSFLANQQKPA